MPPTTAPMIVPTGTPESISCEPKQKANNKVMFS